MELLELKATVSEAEQLNEELYEADAELDAESEFPKERVAIAEPDALLEKDPDSDARDGIAVAVALLVTEPGPFTSLTFICTPFITTDRSLEKTTRILS